MTAFHEILFPLDIALKSAGGPQRRTDVVVLGSGAEERNARWAHSRRRYDAGYGVKTFEALSQVVAFFEERRGRLYGFRWRDRLDQFLRRARRRGRRRPTRRSAPATARPRLSHCEDLRLGSIRPISGRSPSRSPAACGWRSAAAKSAEGTRLHRRYHHRHGDVSRRAYPGERGGGDRRLPVRRAGALRHRLSRGRSLGFCRRRTAGKPAESD